MISLTELTYVLHVVLYNPVKGLIIHSLGCFSDAEESEDSVSLCFLKKNGEQKMPTGSA